MQTFNYNIDLMVPQQFNKELIFNEAILKLDGFCNHVVKGFVDSAPEQFTIGDKYILSQGDRQNDICYIFSESSGWQFLKAKEGMIFFCQQLRQMILFDGSSWQNLPLAADDRQNAQNKFIGIAGEFFVNGNTSHLCFYMSGDAVLNISEVKSDRLTLIIKQNYQEVFRLSWAGQILWPNKMPHQIVQTPNHFDVLEFYKIYETDHFIARIIGIDYQY
jgi:hypothetical protein